jgi:hypothetical protein
MKKSLLIYIVLFGSLLEVILVVFIGRLSAFEVAIK